MKCYLINCEISLNLIESKNCVLCEEDKVTKFAITDAKLHVPVVTLSTPYNSKLLQQLKSGFKRTINWNKYLLKVSTEPQNRDLHFLISPSFHRVNRLFVLPFESEIDRTGRTGYFIPRVEINGYNVKNDGRDFFDQPIENDVKTYENIKKIATGQGDDYTTG